MANNHNPGPPQKKRKIAEDPQPVTTWALPPPRVPKRGAEFLQGIDDLARGGDKAVFTKLDIPYIKREEKMVGRKNNRRKEIVKTPAKVNAVGSFSVMQPGQKEWVQGLLMPMGKTSYFDASGKGKAVPSTLTLKTATVESRAMKFLSMDASEYTPTKKAIARDKKPDSEALSGGKNPHKYNEDEHWGGLTMGSFLEEITASRGLGFRGVGSGMRAMTMAAKWDMKSKKTMQDTGFGERMLKAFPQLGKQAMDEDGMGASAIFDDLAANDTAKNNTLKHHLGPGGSIYKAEVEARRAAKQRFNEKLASLQPNTDAKTLGKWWGRQAQSQDLSQLGADDKRKALKELRQDYVAKKLERHAIRYMKTPHQLAKEMAKKTLAEEGVDKSQTPRSYRRRKHEMTVDAMKSWGFDTAKVEQKNKAERSFAKHLNRIQRGTHEPAKGGWFDKKVQGGTDLHNLDKDERKALKRDYVAFKRNK